MMRVNAVKGKLQEGLVVYGCHSIMRDPAFAEVLGGIGFDFVMMDAEHGPYDPALLEDMVRACECSGVPAFARLPVNDPASMLPFLDTGILGVQVPHCETAKDVATLVSGAKYQPVGRRGVAGSRVSRYGEIPSAEHMAQWNEQLLVIAGVEGSRAVANLKEMVRVPGVDAFAIGLDDLATSLGHPSKHNHRAVQSVVESMVQEIRSANRWVSINVRTTDEAELRRYLDMGVQIIKFSDRTLLRHSATRLLEGARSLYLPATGQGATRAVVD